MLASYVVCDLETTGLNCLEDEIIEVALVRVEDMEVKEIYHNLVNPGRRLSVGIKRLTGISDEMLADKPSIKQSIPVIRDFLGTAPLVGHNIAFDHGFLEAAAGKLFNPLYDTLELARILYPGSPGHGLTDLCQHLQINNTESHRALSDALSTAELLEKLYEKLQKINPQVLIKLSKMLKAAGAAWAQPLENHVQRSLGGFLGNKITGNTFFVAPANPQNGFFQSGDIQGEMAPGEIPGEADMEKMFSNEGCLVSHLEEFEERPQQQQMVKDVYGVLKQGGYLLVEAGTGTGKSMAYLVPAICHAHHLEERVLVATRTINLQEQLWAKDIPFLQRALPWPFRAALVKGRQNYLCLRRWLHVIDTEEWPVSEALFFSRLLIWVSETHTGDRSEINMHGIEHDLWGDVCANHDGCLGNQCRWYAKVCYVARAKRTAESAQVLITNHSLLLSDIRVDNRVLPAYGPLIIDEAHHLEDAATEQLAKQISVGMVRRWLTNLSRSLKRVREPLFHGDSVLSRYMADARKAADELRQGTEVFFDVLYGQLRNISKVKDEEMKRSSIRLRPRAGDGIFQGLTVEADYMNLISRLIWLEECLNKIQQYIIEHELEINDTWAGFLRDLKDSISDGHFIKDELEFIVRSLDDKYVYWAELTLGEGGSCSLHAAPVHIGDTLNQQLYQNRKTIIMTSATMAVDGSFEHFIERTGLNLLKAECGDDIKTLRVDSPFDYESQSLLCLVKDVPGQWELPEEAYLKVLVETLVSILESTGGKTLILFTSHRVLQQVYHRVKPRLEALDICLLGHGIDGSRTRLINQFRTTRRAVLFGANSFWEGVDVPGEALGCVVIVKLPFWAPSIPVIEARMEEMQRMHRDSFRHFSLPQAVIRFKQGFGRLIRSRRDRGVVVVLDNRLINKKYGKYFLNSLPSSFHVRGDVETVRKEILNWFKQTN